MPTQHIIKRFDEELTQLKEHVLAMGGLVEKALKRSMNSLIKQDAKRAIKVIERDKAINALEIQIDEMTRSILALRQPAASDLRLVISTIKIVTDLERMGDLAEDIAEQMLKSRDQPLIHLTTLQPLAEQAAIQLSQALDAFACGNVDSALLVIENDQKSKNLFNSMQRENLTYMLEDPREISSGMIVFAIGRALIRISDHATNIAEMVIYMIRGHDIRHVDHETAAALISGEFPDDD
jgi:phosphate transport system protein